MTFRSIPCKQNVDATFLLRDVILMPNEKYAQKLVQIPWVGIWNPGTGFRSVDLKSSVFLVLRNETQL